MTSTMERTWRAVRWYLREITGESGYDRYVEHERHEHPDRPVVTRREFERERQDRDDKRPQHRCC